MPVSALTPKRARAGFARGLAAGDGILSPVDRDNRVIFGVAVCTRGEALGHGLWLDSAFIDQVVEAGQAKSNGLKCRFTHPGLCADGLGKFLGRLKNFRRDGDIARADLHLSRTASKSPDGDLAEYVMDLADEDPQAFATSIVFDHDFSAEKAFMLEYGGREIQTEFGAAIVDFESPDEDNEGNYPHARVGALFADDVVDEPAANPAGFFGEGSENAARAETVLNYVFGITDTADEFSHAAFDLPRAKTFVQSFLQRHGLKVSATGEKGSEMPKTKAKFEAPEDEKPEEKEMAEGKGEDKEEDEDDGAEPAKESDYAAGAQSERNRFAALRAAFADRPEFVAAQFEAGATVAQAQSAFKDLRIAELESALKNKPAPQNGGESHGAAPVEFQPGGSTPESKSFVTLAREYKAEHKCTTAEAMSKCAQLYPELYDAQKSGKK